MTSLINTPSKELLEELLRRQTPVQKAVPKPEDIFKVMAASGKYKEDPRINHTNPNIKKIWEYIGYPRNTDDHSWCAASLNCALKLCGYQMSDIPSLARSFTSYGVSATHFDLRSSYIIVLGLKSSSWKGHVGFAMGEDKILGGNQDNDLKVKRYDFSYQDSDYELLGYRKITEQQRVIEPDYKTLKEWELWS